MNLDCSAITFQSSLCLIICTQICNLVCRDCCIIYDPVFAAASFALTWRLLTALRANDLHCWPTILKCSRCPPTSCLVHIFRVCYIWRDVVRKPGTCVWCTGRLRLTGWLGAVQVIVIDSSFLLCPLHIVESFSWLFCLIDCQAINDVVQLDCCVNRVSETKLAFSVKLSISLITFEAVAVTFVCLKLSQAPVKLVNCQRLVLNMWGSCHRMPWQHLVSHNLEPVRLIQSRQWTLCTAKLVPRSDRQLLQREVSSRFNQFIEYCMPLFVEAAVDTDWIHCTWFSRFKLFSQRHVLCHSSRCGLQQRFGVPLCYRDCHKQRW